MGNQLLASPKVAPTDDTIQNQQTAGDPQKSIWVSANAGSGKTHILTQRVLRLLLGSVSPENILCLTYTKAAAAEMKSRIAKSLGGWALLDDMELKAKIQAVTSNMPNSGLMERARTLFALALETPGGLKINTIHAFCEAALHRFPLEADVPVNFVVIEDIERAEMVRQAQEDVLSGGLAGDKDVTRAVATLFDLMSDTQIHEAVGSALGQGQELRQILADPTIAKANMRALLGYDENRKLQQVTHEILSDTLLNQKDCQLLVEYLNGDAQKSLRPRFVDMLARMDDGLSMQGLLDAFLTGGGTPRKSLMLAGEQKQYPELHQLFKQEQTRIWELVTEANKISLILRSEAVLVVVEAIQHKFEAAKIATDRLDFDDLITKFETLLAGKTSSDWVRYKLDAGMSHILVDESQDTNPDQWRVIKLLVDDFFDGESAAESTRTIFGVGDEKQSIFGFQGAKPALFGETGTALRLKANQVGKPWEQVRFKASFRTLENILNAVDLVCARDDIRAALLSKDYPVDHESARLDRGGIVTLWPPIKTEKASTDENGWLSEPAPTSKSEARQTAQRIVSQIKSWIENKRPLGTRQRSVVADDILILVQTRGSVFKEIIRALKQSGLPTPGADKLPVTDHIVVRDLLVLGDVLLNPNDDLGLAILLRSPLFDVSNEQLEILSVGRKKLSLWQALRRHAKSQNWAHVAYDTLLRLRKTLDFERCYEFFAQVLFADQGLKKFHARLGEEIDEVIDVFLDLAMEHEQNAQPSLQGFLSAMRAKDIEVKRELSDRGSGVRVMTVHGAKGLEAPIVILADATSKPRLKDSVFMAVKPEHLFVHGAGKKDHTPETHEILWQARHDREVQEYWRKLYVAMTRAEDELYITGFKNIPASDLKNVGLQPSWYGAIKDALAQNMSEISIAGENEKALRFPAELPLVEPATHMGEEASKNIVPVRLDPLPPQTNVETIRPSTAFDESAMDTDYQQDELANSAEQVVLIGNSPKGNQAQKLGVALHSLLQHLLSIDHENRQDIAKNALMALLPDDVPAHQGLIDKAVSILSGPDAHNIFGQNSRAEIPIFVLGHKNQKPVRIIGRIDRTIIENNKVLLVDFKSNAMPPTFAKNISPQYLTQMGLYLRCGIKLFPDHEISTAIYWTSNETLMPLDNHQLLKVTQQFKIS